MANRKDILLNDSGDLFAKSGDFVVNESDVQHVQQLLVSHPGEFKEVPMIGVGLRSEQLAVMSGELRRVIQKGLAADGYKASSVAIRNNKLIIDV